jgi:hypothetical protein
VRAVHVDVVHHVLVPDRVQHEGEVDDRVGPLALEQVAHAAIPDVHFQEAGPRAWDRRRPDVDVHDLVLVALDQEVGETASDIARSAGDEVFHVFLPLARGHKLNPNPTSEVQHQRGLDVPQEERRLSRRSRRLEGLRYTERKNRRAGALSVDAGGTFFRIKRTGPRSPGARSI